MTDTEKTRLAAHALLDGATADQDDPAARADLMRRLRQLEIIDADDEVAPLARAACMLLKVLLVAYGEDSKMGRSALTAFMHLTVDQRYPPADPPSSSNQ
jgi:hypothetical protein